MLGPDSSLTCVEQGKERLPSIVVEPTDVSEVESGELRWPPEQDDYEEDEDLFLEQCIPPANIADWGEEEEEEESSIIISQQQGTSLLGGTNSLFHLLCFTTELHTQARRHIQYTSGTAAD